MTSLAKESLCLYSRALLSHIALILRVNSHFSLARSLSLQWGVPNDIDFIAASFVRKAEDLDNIRNTIRGNPNP